MFPREKFERVSIKRYRSPCFNSEDSCLVWLSSAFDDFQGVGGGGGGGSVISP